MIEYNYFAADSLIIFHFFNTILTFSFKTVKMKVTGDPGADKMTAIYILKTREYRLRH